MEDVMRGTKMELSATGNYFTLSNTDFYKSFIVMTNTTLDGDKKVDGTEVESWARL